MSRCNTTWVKKGTTSVRVTVSDPPDGAVVILSVALIPRRDDLPVITVPSFGKDELEEGAEWETPANYRAVFTLVTSADDPLDTVILIGETQPICPSGDHCYGACEPSGQAGVAGAWALTTWE